MPGTKTSQEELDAAYDRLLQQQAGADFDPAHEWWPDPPHNTHATQTSVAALWAEHLKSLGLRYRISFPGWRGEWSMSLLLDWCKSFCSSSERVDVRIDPACRGSSDFVVLAFPAPEVAVLSPHARGILHRVRAAAGLPDAGDACRTVIAIVNEALGDSNN